MVWVGMVLAELDCEVRWLPQAVNAIMAVNDITMGKANRLVFLTECLTECTVINHLSGFN
ncbi:hypothetical protein AO371_1464 [Moraxella catarrhalis]|nr:hypothetical protein AO371_1464 [Moraxella catarrhalis]